MHSSISKIFSLRFLNTDGFTRRFSLIFALCLGGYGGLLWYNMGAYAGGSDSSGYMNTAKLLGNGHVHTAQRTIHELPLETIPPGNEYLFVPLGFVPLANRQISPTYPVGLPAMILLASKIVGWNAAPGFVIALHAIAGLLLIFRLGRLLGLSLLWAVFGALTLAASPIYLTMSLQTMSDIPATAWSIACVIFAWNSQDRLKSGILAGICLAAAVIIRPTSALLIFAVAMGLGFSWRSWLGLILGGLPGAILFLAYNKIVHGSPLDTGYGDIQSLLSLNNSGPSFQSYFHWLPIFFTPLVFLALGLPWLARSRIKPTVLLGAWIGPIAGFYLFYFHTHENWTYMRFLLPVFPALILAALLVVQRLAEILQPRIKTSVATAMTCAVFVAIIAHGYHASRKLNALSPQVDERLYYDLAGWARKNIPADAIIASMQTSGALFHYTEFTLFRWDTINTEVFHLIQASAAQSHRPIYAILFPFEREDALTKRMPGSWSPVTNLGQAGIWRYEASPLLPP